MLRHVGVGAREQDAPVGDVGVAGPDLVPVDHVLVAVARRGGAQRREVGAGVGLAEALAPAVAPADQAGKEAILDGVAAVRADALHEVAEARARRRARGGDLLVEDHVEHGRQVVTAEPRRPAQPEEPGVVERGVPFGLARPVLVVGRRRGQAGVVLGEPGAQAAAELGFGGRVTKVHRPPPAARAAARAAARRRRRRTTATRATRAAGTRGRCTPTCCRSHRAPGSRSRTRCAARAQYALATRPAERGVGREVVDGPRRVQRDAERALHEAVRLGEQVLHGLERTDRNAVLPALGRVRDGDVEHAAHHADEVGARERQAERGPLGEIVGGEEPALVGDRLHRRPGRDHANGARQIRAGRSPRARRPAPARGGSRRPREPRRTPIRARRRRRPRRSASTSPRRARSRRRRARRENATTAPRRRRARPAREVGREHRARERDVGHRAAEGVGDDGGLDAARERRRRPPSSRSSSQPASRTAAARRLRRVASSRPATVAGPSSRASWRAERRSSACSGVSRVSTGSRT